MSSTSPITFSGFNNIDFGSILNTLMQQASIPLTSLQTQQSNLQSQITNYGTLESNVQALDSAASALDDPASLSAFSASSSDSSAIAVSGAGATSAGHYDVVVNSLARAQVTVSSSVSPDASTTTVASGGSITIGGVEVDLSGNTTLQGLADAINGTSGIGVTANVLQTGANSYRLALTSNVTGAANAFTITNNLTGGAGVTFTDTNGDGISGNSDADNAVKATDADITFNNVDITSTSNTFTNVIPGVTFTILKKDPSTTVGIDVTPDSSALVSNIQSFVDAYNSLASFLSDQRTASANGDQTSIGSDPLLNELQHSITSQVLGAHGAGSVTSLAAIGLGFTQTGQLQFDQSAFAEAMASSPSDVTSLISASDGAFSSIDSALQDYSQASGFISTVQSRLNTEVTNMNGQIADMQNRLAIQKQSLQAEFTAADQAISALQSQSGQLQSLASGLSSQL